MPIIYSVKVNELVLRSYAIALKRPELMSHEFIKSVNGISEHLTELLNFDSKQVPRQYILEHKLSLLDSEKYGNLDRMLEAGILEIKESEMKN